MGEGPTLTTARMRALPLTVWNSGFVAEELAQAMVAAGRGQPVRLAAGELFGGALDSAAAGPADSAAIDPTGVRRELRRRVGAGRGILTWVLRNTDGAALGLLAADAHGARAAIGVRVSHTYRRDGYASEAVCALAGWLESRGAIVGTRVRVGDVVGKRLAQSTAFVPTGVLLTERRRLWIRPPA
ncbi:GNAT family N-acetyltransferase [Parafrankia sp. FMc2]|uniref:GNAT family N-acetyltransferase n=1 Tax=Parafrankia sp. FMc2 TaxID=3233196 RepID=UPI0034D72A6A